MKLLIYVASPYTIGDPAENVNRQIEAGDYIASLGAVPHLPLLAHFWNERSPHDWQFWMDVCEAIVPRCDAVLRLMGESKGADIEVALAEKFKIPVFFSYYRLADWIFESPNT